jgi:hypothetical protein
VRNKVGDTLPKFVWVKPTDLLVEDDYQRNLSERSTRMIGRIVLDWDWAAMKPPICAEISPGSYVVIDGQHTAIAAATHGAIEKIPVMVVSASNLKDRARSFLRHNTERVNITHVQMHRAGLAAGEEIDVAVDAACRNAGVTIRNSNPSCGQWGKGETVAIVSLRQIAEAKGVAGLTRILKILMSARRTPISALELRAVAELIWKLKTTLTDDAISTKVMGRSSGGWEAFARAAGKKASQSAYKALARHWNSN